MVNTKKINMLMTMLCTALIVFTASPSWAAPIFNATGDGSWNYINPIADSVLGYELIDPTPTGETAFATAVLSHYGMSLEGLVYEKSLATFGQKELSGYDPGFSWVFAVVKVDGPNDFSYLFWDNQVGGGDDLLTTPLYGTSPYNMANPPNGLGISHVSFFRTATVPEPLTLLLLGLGMLGLAGVRRFRN